MCCSAPAFGIHIAIPAPRKTHAFYTPVHTEQCMTEKNKRRRRERSVHRMLHSMCLLVRAMQVQRAIERAWIAILRISGRRTHVKVKRKETGNRCARRGCNKGTFDAKRAGLEREPFRNARENKSARAARNLAYSQCTFIDFRSFRRFRKRETGKRGDGIAINVASRQGRWAKISREPRFDLAVERVPETLPSLLSFLPPFLARPRAQPRFLRLFALRKKPSENRAGRERTRSGLTVA